MLPTNIFKLYKYISLMLFSLLIRLLNHNSTLLSIYLLIYLHIN